MALEEYRRKREFRVTPEPRGKKGPRHRFPKFVVQKHDASHLHYDFRLEMDGVLKSWAVPKGPSLNPRDKRLAVEVEDHPLEYGSFEGTIPQGQYGAGTVMLWDNGTWEPVGDAMKGYASGKLKFRLHGEKLNGGFSLVRMRKPHEKHPTWLLMKERDDDARQGDEEDVLKAAPLSVKTGRTLEQIEEGRRPSNGTRAAAATGRSKSSAEHALQENSRVRSSEKKGHRPRSTRNNKRDSMPVQISPELATLVDQPPDGDDWLHEVKFDGYRLICRIDGSHIQLLTRNHLDWTPRFPALATALKSLPLRSGILDGEVVVLDEHAVSSFQRLQNSFSASNSDAFDLYLFDLLYLDGKDLQSLPLVERKQRLQELLAAANEPHLHYSDHVIGNGPLFFRECARRGLEGMISKRRDSRYSQIRTTDWLKSKCVHEDEFVIGGFTEPAGSRSGFGALLLGHYDEQGELTYVGKVGTGFAETTLTRLAQRLKAIQRKTSPFKNELESDVRRAHFVRPLLVAQIRFASWTADGRLRQATFQGLREDKEAAAVTSDKMPSDDRPNVKGASAMKYRSSESSALLDISEEELQRLEKALEDVKLTHPDRVMYPKSGLSKLQLAAYYVDVADQILPHIVERPLSLLRCPDGVDGSHFYQKHAGNFPAALRRVPIPETNGPQEYLVADNLAGLIALVQMGVLEIHPWGSRADNIERPDRVIFDFDPDPAVRWSRVIEIVQESRDRLSRLKLECFLKATGGKGLHLVVPIQRRHSWAEINQFAKSLAEQIVADSPNDCTTNIRKSARAGKIFIDVLRNSQGATAIAPFSTRANPNASVAVPLAWDELSTDIHSDSFDVISAAQRLRSLGRDPWEHFFELKQSLSHWKRG